MKKKTKDIYSWFFLTALLCFLGVMHFQRANELTGLLINFFNIIMFIIHIILGFVFIMLNFPNTSELLKNLGIIDSDKFSKKISTFLKAIIKGLMILITSPFFILGIIWEYIRLSFCSGKRTTIEIDKYLLNEKSD